MRAILLRCNELYAGYLERSKQVGEDRFFEGLVQDVIEPLPYSNSYYAHANRHLRAMGCVSEISRGGGHYGRTKLLLVQPPTEELYTQVVRRRELEPVTYQRDADILDRIRRIEERLDDAGL